MPCRDYDDRELLNECSEENRFLRAALCGLMTVLENDDAAFASMLKKIDWKETGVSKREFLSWWEDHKEEDRQRREREAAAKREKELRASGLSKLSEEEKKALGLKG